MTDPDDRTPAGLQPWQATVAPIAIAMLGMLGPFSIDTPYPSFAHLQTEFAVDATVTQQLVSSYLLAFAAMSIFHGPISDAVGRRPVMLVSLLAYSVASIAAIFAPSIGVLIFCRVLQGLSAGGGVIISRTMIRDLYHGADAQRLMSRVMMIFGLAPALAPIIGGWLATVGSWRLIFGFLGGLGLLLVGVVIVALPESHPVERRTPLSIRALLGSMAGVVRTARFHRVTWAGAFLFGAYFLYIGSAAIVVVDLLGQGETDFWKLFLPMIAGFMAGAFVSGRTAGRLSRNRGVAIGIAIQLGAAALGVVLMLAPALRTLPWAVIAPAILGFGVSLAFPPIQLAVVDMFPNARGAATSIAAFLTLALNALTAGLLAPVITSSLLAMAIAVLGFTILGALFWVWHLRVDHQVDRQ
ncbi:multidrug effflux MFS transporter [Naumannella huperziae]